MLDILCLYIGNFLKANTVLKCILSTRKSKKFQVKIYVSAIVFSIILFKEDVFDHFHQICDFRRKTSNKEKYKSGQGMHIFFFKMTFRFQYFFFFHAL